MVASVDPALGAIDPALLNFAWDKRGQERIMPARIYDDGSATYMLWGSQQDIPSILVETPDGREVPAELAIRGNTIVIAGVPRAIVLQNGRAKARLQSLRETAPAVAPVEPAAPQDN